MRRSAVFLGLALGSSFLVTMANDAFGHAHMDEPMRRANCQGGGDDLTCKGAGPCGGTPNPAITPTVFHVGSSYDLSWSETIDHPSTYQLNLSTNGAVAQADFFPVMPEGTVMDQTAVATTYTWQWTVPAWPGCDPGPCVMQLIQDMNLTAGITNPYYNCADVRILPAGAATPTPGTSPTPSPTSTPNQDGPVSVDGYGSCAVGGVRSTAIARASLALALGLGLVAFARRRRS